MSNYKSLQKRLERAWESMERVHAHMGAKAAAECKDGTHELRETLAQEAFRRTKEEIYDWGILYDPKNGTPDDQFAAWMGLYQECWHENYMNVLREAYDRKLDHPNKDALWLLVRKLHPGDSLLWLNAELTNMRDRDAHLKAAAEAFDKGDHETAAWKIEAAVETGYEFLDIVDF